MPKTRTPTENACRWKWCEMLAERLNDAGVTHLEVIDELKTNGIESVWSKDSVAKLIFDPYRKAIYQVESSTQLETTNTKTICLDAGNFVAIKFGVSPPPWPDKMNGGGQDDGFTG